MAKFTVLSRRGGVYVATATSLDALFDKDHLVSKRFIKVKHLTGHQTLLHIDAVETVTPALPEGVDTE